MRKRPSTSEYQPLVRPPKTSGLKLQQVARRDGRRDHRDLLRQRISGSKGRDKRPAFDRLCKDAAQRRFDLIMAWSVDRLGRRLQDLIGFLAEIHALRVDLYLHQQGSTQLLRLEKRCFKCWACSPSLSGL